MKAAGIRAANSRLKSGCLAAFAILMCGHTTPEVESEWGDYGDMAERLLANKGREEEWRKFCVCDGVFPADKDLQEVEGIVITGSKHDAFADDPWIVELRDLARREAYRGQRILGLCFGCQILAVALGGKAGRADCGWESGARPMELLPSFFTKPYASTLPAAEWKLNLHQTHRDQVLELPPGSELLASSRKTKYEMWQWRDNVLAVQGHPEFTVAFQHALNRYRVALGTMQPEEKLAAEASMKQYPVTPQNAVETAEFLKAFLKGPSTTEAPALV